MSSEAEPPQLATPSLETLQNKLDLLWEQHLQLLDQYDTAQKQVQKHFSSVCYISPSFEFYLLAVDCCSMLMARDRVSSLWLKRRSNHRRRLGMGGITTMRG